MKNTQIVWYKNNEATTDNNDFIILKYFFKKMAIKLENKEKGDKMQVTVVVVIVVKWKRFRKRSLKEKKTNHFINARKIRHHLPFMLNKLHTYDQIPTNNKKVLRMFIHYLLNTLLEFVLA